MRWTREQAVLAEHLRKNLEDIYPLMAEFDEQYEEARGSERARITRARKPFEVEESKIKEALKDLPPPPMSEEEAINNVQEILVEFCQEYKETREAFATRAAESPEWAVEGAKDVLVLQCQYRIVVQHVRGWDGSFASLKKVLEDVREYAGRKVGYYNPTSGSSCVFHKAVEAAEYLAYRGLANPSARPISWHLRLLYERELDCWAERVQVWQVLR